MAPKNVDPVLLLATRSVELAVLYVCLATNKARAKTLKIFPLQLFDG